MRSLIVFVLALLLLAVPATAQDRVDYAIDHIRDPILNSDGSLVEVVFDVVNEGAVDASTTATVRVTNQQNGEEIAKQTLEPLAAGVGVTVTLTIPVDELPQEGTQNLLLTVGIGEVEPDSGDVANNFGHVMLRPLDQMQGQVQNTPEAQPTEAVPGETEAPAPTPDTGLTILGFTFNTRDPLHVAALIAIALALLIMALLLIVIVRLLFRRRPVFQIEAPPYANMPMLATSTNAGRRQGWQFHAQNDLPPPHHAAEGETHIRKLLTGMDGVKFANWEISGLRLSQYDQYGRISRSEVIASARRCRRLTRIATRAREADVQRLERGLRAVARPLAREFSGNINRRSAMLPIALDLRFEGGHGEVRIFFELFHLEQGRWARVDAWEPEMMVRGPVIHENFTYTLQGMQPGENYKAFSQRFSEDLTQVLTLMLQHPRPASPDDDTGRSRRLE